MKLQLCSLAFVLAVAACSREPAAPSSSGTRLESLSFVSPSVAVGDPLILTASTATSVSVPIAVDVTASSGSHVVAQLGSWSATNDRLGPWSDMTAAELGAYFTASRGGGVIGFKEANAAAGVDSLGNSLVSDSTVARTTQWVEDQGITVTRRYGLIPAVVVDLPMPIDVQLITKIRTNANIDYLEPDVPLKFNQDPPSGAGVLGAVIATTGSATGLMVRSGDTVTATYVQPDGSKLSARVAIQ